MRIHNHKWNIWSRRITVLLLLCGLLLPIMPHSDAASVTYEYKWIKSTAGLPADSQWHDFFIAWEDLDDKTKYWFTDYHWYTADGDNNIDVGGSHWMEYKAASTLSDITSSSFTSKEALGHMQIKYAGRDKDNGDSPKYYIRVSQIQGGYSYFTSYEPTNNEKSADAFTFLNKGDVFHIFVNISGKADRYLTRDGQYLETTESSSYGGGDKYRPLRLYQRTFAVDESDSDDIKDVIGKVTLHEYHWVNTAEEMVELSNKSGWVDIMLAWEDANGGGTSNPDKVWYSKEVWFDSEGAPNYENGVNNEFYYYSNDYLGSDGYGSAYAESFILPSKASHFQVKRVGWDKDNPIHGYTKADGKKQNSPMFNFRFETGHGRHVYIGNNGFYDEATKAEEYTVQLRLGKKNSEDIYGSVWIINNMTGEDEMITRCKNRFDVSNWIPSKYWEFPFRIYSHNPVEYDAIVKSFTIGNGATYSIDEQLIVDTGVTITVEDGGILTVDDHLLNNGNIIVKNGGTLVVNEGGYIMAYDQNAEGKISLDGGNMIIMDDAKVICDQNGSILEAKRGATIFNRGLLLVGKALVLNNNTCLVNDKNGILLVGGRIAKERGGIGAFTIDEVLSRVETLKFTYLISNKSKIINKGIITEPLSVYVQKSDTAKNSIIHVGNGKYAKH